MAERGGRFDTEAQAVETNQRGASRVNVVFACAFLTTPRAFDWYRRTAPGSY
jgi:hypothetical protein